jgi:hypothetical protein
MSVFWKRLVVVISIAQAGQGARGLLDPKLLGAIRSQQAQQVGAERESHCQSKRVPKAA